MRLTDEPVKLRIADVRAGDSPRLGGIDMRHVRRLVEAGQFPPVIVDRLTMRLVDGQHRLRAAALQGREEIEAHLFEGTPEEAFTLAVRSNVRHGLVLSVRERSAAARRLLLARPTWSDRAVARACGLSVRTVSEIRRATDDLPTSNIRVGLDGRTRPLNSAEGRRRAADYLGRYPGATLREVASAAGISPGTARDVKERLERGEDPVPPGVRGPAASVRALPVTPDPLAVLLQDPALRSSEDGRLLLRLLDTRPLTAARRDRWVRAVPAHQRETVQEAAWQCVRAWHDFALSLGEGAPAASAG